MTNQNQRNSLEARISDYANFMKICPKHSIVKLAQEIARLQARVNVLTMMEPHRLRENVDVYFDTKQSKMNLKTIPNPDVKERYKLPKTTK